MHHSPAELFQNRVHRTQLIMGLGFRHLSWKTLFRLYASWILMGAFTYFSFWMENYDCRTVVLPAVGSKFERAEVATTCDPCPVNSTCQCTCDTQCIDTYNSEHMECTKKKTCDCEEQYITVSVDTFCDYRMEAKLTIFLLSFFVGGFGVDWACLARGNACYKCAAAGKCLTLGGCGIWWFTDWIRVLSNDFPDGNGQPLWDNM